MPSPTVEGTDFGKALGMESDAVWEAVSSEMGICGERVLEPALRRVPSADREVGRRDVGNGFELERSFLGSERTLS